MTWKLQVKDKYFADYAVEFDEKHIDFLVYPKDGSLFADTFLWAESKRNIPLLCPDRGCLLVEHRFSKEPLRP